MFKDNPLLIQLRSQLRTEAQAKPPVTSSAKKQSFSKGNRDAGRKPNPRPNHTPATEPTVLFQKQPTPKPAAPVIETKRSMDDYRAAILAQIEKWGKVGVDAKIQECLVGVMMDHGVAESNRIIAELKLYRLGWTFQEVDDGK